MCEYLLSSRLIPFQVIFSLKAVLTLRSIVGEGNHSVDHIQKIKPRVEQVCQELGLQYVTEPNAGRMFINLQGGPAVMPPSHGGGQHAGPQPGYHAPQQSGYQAHQQPQAAYQGGQQQQNNQQDEVVGLLTTLLKLCCK
jgi:hypothetical protein